MALLVLSSSLYSFNGNDPLEWCQFLSLIFYFCFKSPSTPLPVERFKFVHRLWGGVIVSTSSSPLLVATTQVGAVDGTAWLLFLCNPTLVLLFCATCLCTPRAEGWLSAMYFRGSLDNVNQCLAVCGGFPFFWRWWISSTERVDWVERVLSLWWWALVEGTTKPDSFSKKNTWLSVCRKHLYDVVAH